MFGKFKKLTAKPTAGESSSGLGLCIAKQLTEMHDGKLWVESIEGQGSTFCLELVRV
jgi:signal transduction histidine kinase